MSEFEKVQVSLDLETLGTGSASVILSIGAAAFVPLTGEIREVFSINVDLQSQLDAGRKISASTFQWWLSQSEKARKAVRVEGHPFREALVAFSDWYSRMGSVGAWGNGSSFNVSILESAFETLRMSPPWKYREPRDMRTLVTLARDLVGFEPSAVPSVGEAHVSVDDAVYQAQVISTAVRSLRDVVSNQKEVPECLAGLEGLQGDVLHKAKVATQALKSIVDRDLEALTQGEMTSRECLIAIVSAEGYRVSRESVERNLSDE